MFNDRHLDQLVKVNYQIVGDTCLLCDQLYMKDLRLFAILLNIHVQILQCYHYMYIIKQYDIFSHNIVTIHKHHDSPPSLANLILILNQGHNFIN